MYVGTCFRAKKIRTLWANWLCNGSTRVYYSEQHSIKCGPYEQRVMLANHPGGFFSVCEWYPSVSCQCQWEIYRAVTSCQPAFVRPFAAATQHILSLLKANKESWRRFCWAGWKGEERCQDHSRRTALTHQRFLASLSKSYFFLNINDNKRQMESWTSGTAICSAFWDSRQDLHSLWYLWNL